MIRAGSRRTRADAMVSDGVHGDTVALYHECDGSEA
jgi:hypothetical protein